MTKNIVVMCDGTWNSPNSETNVNTLYKELIEKDYKQHVMYLDRIGIGELAFNFIIDGAIACYTARCIAGLIRNCGILKLDRDTTPYQIDKFVNVAYDIYRNRDKVYHPEGPGSDDFKKSFSYPDTEKPIIKFLGLWDTVGAYGLSAYVIGEGFKYLEFYDQTVPNIVNYACQALAIHERTSFFEPCHIYPSNSNKTIIKETWFSGVHMEIGGGNFLGFGGNERISKATLLWTIENITQVEGLLMKNDIGSYRARLSPDYGPSWNLKNLLFDHSNDIIPFIDKDRVIPLDLDPSQKFLRKDLLYRDGDWSLPFGSRTHLIIQYPSNTYEELHKIMEKKGIRLYNNVIYDKETIENSSERASL